MEPVAADVLVPGVEGEELLQGPHSAATGQGDRLDALAWQVAGQAADAKDERSWIADRDTDNGVSADTGC
ncbi:MAG: hypothetical protein AMXMBFR83_01970 [Phycisphaerae bacterium]